MIFVPIIRYLGIGVASREISGKKAKGGECLHISLGCSVYYGNGIYYPERPWREATRASYHPGDFIDVYFDVDNHKVEYYKNETTLVIRYSTIGKYPKEKGLRLAVVVGSHVRVGGSKVVIVDYQPVQKFPDL